MRLGGASGGKGKLGGVRWGEVGADRARQSVTGVAGRGGVRLGRVGQCGVRRGEAGQGGAKQGQAR